MPPDPTAATQATKNQHMMTFVQLQLNRHTCHANFVYNDSLSENQDSSISCSGYSIYNKASLRVRTRVSAVLASYSQEGQTATSRSGMVSKWPPLARRPAPLPPPPVSAPGPGLPAHTAHSSAPAQPGATNFCISTTEASDMSNFFSEVHALIRRAR